MKHLLARSSTSPICLIFPKQRTLMFAMCSLLRTKQLFVCVGSMHNLSFMVNCSNNLWIFSYVPLILHTKCFTNFFSCLKNTNEMLPEWITIFCEDVTNMKPITLEQRLQPTEFTCAKDRSSMSTQFEIAQFTYIELLIKQIS
jgi:hypothetical protein